MKHAILLDINFKLNFGLYSNHIQPLTNYGRNKGYKDQIIL